MDKILRSRITLYLFLAIFFVVGVSYLISPNRSVYALLIIIGAAIVSVTSVAANLIKIYGKPEKSNTTENKNTQTGNGINIIAKKIDADQIGGSRTTIEHADHVTIGPSQDEKASPEELEKKLPKLPPRGKLPKVGDPLPGSRMPHTRNAVFTGRETDLLTLADDLIYAERPTNVAVTQIEAVTGMGGIGKTQLAVEFCYRYGRYFQGVHWINCRDTDIDTEISECGREMGIDPWPEQVPDQVAATLRVWKASKRRLVILDNLEDPEILRNWMPRLSASRLLLTARRLDWPADLGLQSQPLGLLSVEECRDLLRKLAERLKDLPDDQLDQISAKLGYLALAIDLAGHYLNDRETLTADGYLAEVAEQENLLQHSSLLDWVEGSPTQHETSLAATFKMSLDRLAGNNENKVLSRKIFLLAGWCAPGNPIPRELLLKASGVEEESDFDRAIKTVCSLGVLERSTSGFLIHPLLSAFSSAVSAEGQDQTLDEIGEAFIDLAGKAYDSGLPTNYLPLHPHLQHFCSLGSTDKLRSQSRILNIFGLNLLNITRYDLAKSAFERALKIDEAVYGPDHPQVAIRVNNLGGVLRALGDLAGARASYERALKIDEAVYGPDHPEVATDVNNLGGVLRDLGDLAGARTCYERALKIVEAVYGPEHPKVATTVNNLGSVLQALGDLAGARVSYERALKIFETVYGPDHPRVAGGVNNLGAVLRALGDLAGARASFARALKIDEAVYGPDHPDVAGDVNNLGSVLQALGDLAGAKASYERALKILVKFLPADHPNIKIVRGNLASLDEEK